MDGTSAQRLDLRPIARSVGTVLGFRAGDVVFREGDAPHCMYVVLDGTVEVRRRDLRIETIGPGQALGILSILDGERRTITAEAATDCELAAIDARKFRALVEEMPHFGWYVMGELAHRLRMTNAHL
ncbi:Crp/Fnr family transcriptional regulator [Siccirubricoccus phaeus]|uniref:Crp/Fnr family transcriptional regulator n=1 Tax=Siccirubricoccus phaeus TaxID=2595053 RepID=UPI00165C4316|nr:Crp/Fnr family transcriptional regulator [Siccirubricoccus phaeus]